MKHMFKQWMAGLLAAVLVLTLLPAAALADQPDGEAGLPAQETAEPAPELEEAAPEAAELAEEPEEPTQEEEPVEEAEEPTEEAEEPAPEVELTALEDVPMAIAFDDANGGDGNADTPYEINTLEQFKAFRDYINADEDGGSGEYFKLTASINLGGSDEWTPIGADSSHPFQGTFDGGNFTISGLYINTNPFYAGLFGYSQGGTIKNLAVSGNIANGAWAGGIVGDNHSGSSIKNCYYSGTVAGNDVGGIAGNNYDGSIENCYNIGTVSKSSTYVGGITGLNTSSGSVSNCYYLNTCGGEGDGTSKTEEEFKSGEVAWLLQNGQDTPEQQVWGQQLGEGGDDYPVFTSDGNKKVLKVTFATQDNEEYAAKYANPNGTVEMPKNPESENYTFGKWATTQDAEGDEFNEETVVTEDMTVYAMGSVKPGAVGEYTLPTDNYGYVSPITVNLDNCMKEVYKIISPEGKFTYEISDQGSTNARIESENTLTIPTGLDAGVYTITVKATEKEPQYALMSVTDDSGVTLKVTFRLYHINEETPTIAIDYENEMLTGFETDASYTINGADVSPADGKLSATDYIGSIVSIVRKTRNSTNYYDSHAQSLDVPARPAAPSVEGAAPTTHDGKGKITGADTTMVYREKTDGDTEEWQDCTEGEIEVAPDKTYEVRTKAVPDEAFASEIKEVNVPAFTPTTITGTVTIDGEVKLGQQLTAVTTAVEPSGIDFTYQWQRSGDDGGYTDIGGATEETYTLTVADVGKTIQVVVTANDPDYTGSLSAVTDEVPKGTITGIVVTANPGITAYTGEEQTLVNVTGNQDSDTIEYKVEKKGDSDSYSVVGSTNSATDAGTYKVTVTVKREGYNDYAAPETEVTIAKAESSATAPTAKKDLTYTGGAQQLIDAGTATGGTMKYYVGESAPSDGDSQWKTEAAQITGTEAKEYKVWYYVDGDANHNDTEAQSITATIDKAAPGVTPPTAKELTYTGAAQTLAEAGSTDGGTMTYSDSESGTYSDSIPQGTEAKTYEVWYKVTGDGNHTDATPAKIDVTIAQAAPVVTVEADLGIYGEDITLTAEVTSGAIGAENITGAVTFTAGETELGTAEAKDVGGRWTLTVLGTERAKQQALFGEAGTSTVTAQYSGNTNIAGGTGTEDVTVAAKPLTYTVTAEDREYNGANTIDVTLTPNDLVVGDDVTLSATGTLSSANAETYTTVYLSGITKTGADEKYYSVEGTNPDATIQGGVTISPRVVELAWTLDGGETFTVDYTGAAHTAAATVSNTVASDEVNVTVQVTVTGDDEATEAIEVGAYTATATALTGAAQGNYTLVGCANTTQAFTIQKVAAAVTAEPQANAGLTYTAAPQALVTAGTPTGGTMVYALGTSATDAPVEGYESALPAAANAGTYYVWWKVQGDVDHRDTAPACLTVAIAQAAATVTAPTANAGLTYTGAAQALITAGKVESDVEGCGTMQYSLDGDAYSADLPTGTDAKTYTVYWKVDGADETNYAYSDEISGQVTVTIDKAAATVTAPTANAGLTYTGAAQALVTAGQTADGAEVYALGDSATDAPAEGYELTVPAAANAGTYYVWWKVLGDVDHSDSAPACVTVTIAPAALTFQPVAVETPYTGAAIFVPVAQTAGQTPAIDPEKLAVSYEQDGAAVEPILPGTYDVLVNLTDANFVLAGGAERVKMGTLTITHVHVYGEAWAHDELNHWHTCQGAGDCDAPQSGLAAHTWDDGVVALEPTVEAEGSRLYTCSVCGATRSEAISKLNTFQISGLVTDHAGNPLAGAAIRLTQGSDTVAEAVTDDQGRYSFSSVPAGLYNVAATWDEVTKTILVELSDTDAHQQDIQMPEGKTTSVVEVLGEDTPDVVVGGVDAVAEAEAAAPDEVVTVTLTVAKEEEPAGKDEIAQLVTGKKDDVLYLDLSLLKQVNTQPTQAITDTGARVLEIVVPYDFSAKRSVTVYRKHGDDPAAALTALSVQPDLAEAEDGSFFADRENGRIAIYASKFSTYAIAYQAAATASTSGGSSSVARYTITATAGEGGAIDPAGATQVRRGESQSYAIRPDEGFEVADVLVDGESVGAVTTYTFENVAAAHTIQAVFQKIGEGEGALPFTDVASGDWFYDSVKDVYQRGLMQGVSAATFAPDQSTTRAMVVTILYRLEGEPGAPRNIAFADVAPGLWYTDAISWAAANGIVEGYSQDAFGPEDLVTREQLAAILYRYAAYKGADVSGQADLTGYTDASAVSDWAREGVSWAVQAGLIQGRSATTLVPAGTSTRAELAAVLARYLQA